MTGTQGTPLGLDVTTPNVARMYDYYLGGKDNFEPDRIAAEKVPALVPGLRRAAVENRLFGSWRPKPVSPSSSTSPWGCPLRVPCKRSCARSTPGAGGLRGRLPGRRFPWPGLLAVTDLSIMMQGDLRRPAELLAKPEVRARLDFGQPAAIGVFAILHFLHDADDPAGIVRACAMQSDGGAI